MRAHERRKPSGRKPIPSHRRRVEIEILPNEVRRKGLDAFEKIGEDVTEVVERRPASRGRAGGDAEVRYPSDEPRRDLTREACYGWTGCSPLSSRTRRKMLAASRC